MQKEFRAWKRLFVLQWHNAASMRASFLTQVVGMMVNNAGIAAIWVIFISVFGNVNGWGVADVLMVQGIGSVTFGLAYGFCAGAIFFPNEIRSGSFDAYFLRPLRVLPLVWRSTFMESTFGDLLYGVLLIAIACVMASASVPMFAFVLVMSVPGAILSIAMSTLTGSYAFWRPDDRMISDMMMRVFMVPTMYPAGAFPSVMRVVYTFIIPSLLVAGIPWESARGHALGIAALVWVGAFVWLGVAALVFHMGLRRYESGGTGA